MELIEAHFNFQEDSSRGGWFFPGDMDGFLAQHVASVRHPEFWVWGFWVL